MLQQLPIAYVHRACACHLACALSEVLEKLTGEHQRPDTEGLGHAADK